MRRERVQPIGRLRDPLPHRELIEPALRYSVNPKMFSPELARALRKRDHDVVAVGERGDLSGALDAEVLATAAREERALLREDVADFTVLAQDYARQGEAHCGIVLTSAARFTRRRAGLGRLVRALEAFLTEHPAADALDGRLRWLERD